MTAGRQPSAEAPRTPLTTKLGIHPPMAVALLGAAGSVEELAVLPSGIRVLRALPRGRTVALIVVFVTARRELERRLPRLLEAVAETGALWVAWPKRASGRTSDLSDTVVRETVLPSGWVDTKVCSIDTTWSGLKFVHRLERRGPKGP